MKSLTYSYKILISNIYIRVDKLYKQTKYVCLYKHTHIYFIVVLCVLCIYRYFIGCYFASHLPGFSLYLLHYNSSRNNYPPPLNKVTKTTQHSLPETVLDYVFYLSINFLKPSFQSSFQIQPCSSSDNNYH